MKGVQKNPCFAICSIKIPKNINANLAVRKHDCKFDLHSQTWLAHMFAEFADCKLDLQFIFPLFLGFF